MAEGRADILRYPKLWLSLLRNSLARELEYKANFIGRVCVELVWIATQVLFFGTALRLTDRFGNFGPDEVWFFVGTLFFVDGLFMMLIHDNQNQFGRMVRGGLLDFHLLRPASVVFLAGFRYVNTIALTNLALASGLLAWAGIKLGLGPGAWLLWGLHVALGVALIACLSLSVCAVAFWTTQSSNLVWAFFEFYRLGFRPETVYDPWLRRILLSVFPAAFFVSIPVQLTLGKLDGWWFAAPWAMLGLGVALTRLVWSRGLRRYEGALS